MPDWKPVRKGDLIRYSVRDENKLRQRAFRPMSVSSYSSGIQTPNLKALNPEAPHREYEVEITNLKASDDDTKNSALYLCRFRCYGTTDAQWESKTDEYLLDALDAGSQLFVGARITARWDKQRGAFVPCHPSIGAAILTSALTRLGTATANVLNRSYGELQSITVKDFIGILAGDYQATLPVGTMVYFLPVSYHLLDSDEELAGRSIGSTVQYEIIAVGTGPTAVRKYYAKVKASTYPAWTNTKGETGKGSWVSEAVEVQTCDYDGADATGSTFQVKTKPQKNKDTALFTDYIIKWEEDHDGTKVIVSDIWDDPIGTIKWESLDTANIRDGWRLCDGASGAPDLRGRFIMHRDTTDSALNDDVLPANSENAIAKTGGARFKTTSYAFDSLGGVSAQSTPADGWPTATVKDDDNDILSADIKESMSPDVVPPAHDDIRPRFYAMAAIQRYA